MLLLNNLVSHGMGLGPHHVVKQGDHEQVGDLFSIRKKSEQGH